MPIVNFVNEKKEIEVPQGANLRQEALRAGVDLYPGVHKVLNCHGLGNCGSCRVLITEGRENASQTGLWEKARMAFSLHRIGKEDEIRLACCTKVEGDMTVETQPGLDMYGDNFFS